TTTQAAAAMPINRGLFDPPADFAGAFFVGAAPREAGAAAAFLSLEALGTSTFSPHSGQSKLPPAFSSAVLRPVSHFGHEKRIMTHPLTNKGTPKSSHYQMGPARTIRKAIVSCQLAAT